MTQEEEIKKGFNDGFAMQNKKPKLAIQIAEAFDDPSHPYAQGFIAGTIEKIKELGQSREVYSSLLKEKKPKSIDKGLDITD